MPIQPIPVPFANDVARWGAAKGPAAMMAAGMAEALRAAGHSVAAPVEAALARAQRTRDPVTNLGIIAAWVSAQVAGAIGQGAMPLVLQGNCTQSVGPAGGVARACGRAGIAWFDAHGDMHTLRTTSTGLLGGMPFAVALGWEFDDWRLAAGLAEPVAAGAAALIGASDLDPEEEAALAGHGIARLDAAEMGADAGARTTALLAGRAAAAPGWYLHIDMDVAGPEAVPGQLTNAPHWPSAAALAGSVEAAARAVPLRCLGVAAYDPAGDPTGKGAGLAVALSVAALRHLA